MLSLYEDASCFWDTYPCIGQWVDIGTGKSGG